MSWILSDCPNSANIFGSKSGVYSLSTGLLDLTHAKSRFYSILPIAASLCSHSCLFPSRSLIHFSCLFSILPTGWKYFPWPFLGASGLVAQYREFKAPSSTLIVGVSFIIALETYPKELSRLVLITPGWSEYAVTPWSCQQRLRSINALLTLSAIAIVQLLCVPDCALLSMRVALPATRYKLEFAMW